MSTKAPKKTTTARRRSPRKNKPLDHSRIIIFLLTICGLTTLSIGFVLAWLISLNLPDIRTAADYRPLVATIILDRNGVPIDAIFKGEYRILISQDQMEPLLAKAFVAAEDARYFEHPGLDLWSIARAAFNNLRSGRHSQGGSTITQQVTRALLLSREKTWSRKISEAILSYRLEKMLSKEDILNIYLNEIYLGAGAYGVEAAARVYFSKSVRELNLAEMAMLAGLPQSPSRYSPIRNYEAARARQRYVLNRMAEDNIITAETARKAWQYKVRLNPAGKYKNAAGYFTSYIRMLLKEHYGEEAIYREGLTVWTTLDSRMQAIARKTVNNGTLAIKKRQKKQTRPQGALIAIENSSGRIRAMVGGNDYRQSPFNRAVMASRQPGSAFKPFVYAAAFEKKIHPELKLNDAPFSFRNRDGSVWRPKNYSNRYHGSTSLREALIHSRNIVTIKLLQKVGVKPVIKLAEKSGITSEMLPELTLALGSSPVTLLEMTASYTIFPGRGLYRQPRAITRVQDRAGRVTPWPHPATTRVISNTTANQITEILRQAVREGTGKKAGGIPGAAGKTGTSNNNFDAWFIGYTDRLTTGIWFGHDRERNLGRNETGGRTAAPLWKDFMEQVGR